MEDEDGVDGRDLLQTPTWVQLGEEVAAFTDICTM